MGCILVKITAKIHLRPTAEQALALYDTLLEANAACNKVSDYAFEHKVFRQFDLHKAQYYPIKESFKLSAQLIVRCLSKVSDAYKLDKDIKRTFKATGGIAYDARILSLNTAKSQVSIWTVTGRQKIPYTTNTHNARLLAYQKGESDLALVKGKYFLLLTCDIPDESTDEFEDVLGIDLGIIQIATDSDGQTFSGAKIEATRQWYLKRRSALQSVGTKSAKCRLKKLAKTQRLFQRDTNHVISKSLVLKAKGTSRAIAIEQLKGISKQVRKEAKRLRQTQRAKHSNWSFDQLKQFLTYKCQMYGVMLTTIDPRNTSRTCAVCGHCEKANRKSQAEFVCRNCFHSTNADMNAAKNIQTLGRQSTGLWSRNVMFQGQAPCL